jgi:hypothetical protein
MDETEARRQKRLNDTRLDAAKSVEERFWMMNSLSLFAVSVHEAVRR